MAKKVPKDPADYIEPLNINGLEGRMLRAPSTNKKRTREILLVYGHHGTLERWWGLVENLQEYGTVTMADVPGFGGMDSFYTIGRQPNIDAFADYLAAFIKLRYRRKRLSIAGISFGFVIVTRMLQRYPELAKKVDLLISFVGFSHKDDFWYSRSRRYFYSKGTRFLSIRPVSALVRALFFNHLVLSTLYQQLPAPKRRMLEASEEEFRATIEYDVQIWLINDSRTHWFTISEFLMVDNCKQRVDLPVHHVMSANDHYFNNEIVKQHMLVAFKSYKEYTFESKAHTPSILADKKAAGIMLPAGLRRTLSRAK